MDPARTFTFVLCVYAAAFPVDLTVASSHCNKADIAFVLDSSGSIEEHNWRALLQFTNAVVSTFDIGTDAIQIGVISYSTAVQASFYFNSYSHKIAITDAISKIQFEDAGTNTGGALALMHTELFTAAKGARSDVPWTAILITDGHADKPNEAVQEATKARNKNIAIFAIGIGDVIDQAELNAIANKPSEMFVFNAQNFHVLPRLKERVSSAACVKVCSSEENLCYNGEQCLPISWWCDGLNDCFDNSDEANCSCSSNPCMNGGSCQYDSNGYTCGCPVGYQGTQCQIDICDSACHNGGSCYVTRTGYRCNCVNGFTGDSCETNICDSACHNGGSCYVTRTGYRCNCVNGFTGDSCETNSDICDSACHNGGSCYVTRTGYRCNCVNGFTGDSCETNICDSACDNGGTCYVTRTGYRCNCVNGFTGDSCQNKICDAVCLNGGTCYVTRQGSRCSCAAGFTGRYCERRIDVCASHPCLNNGSCIQNRNTYTCKCPSDVTGRNCETGIPHSGVVLLFANRRDVRRLDVNSGVQTLITSLPTNAVALDFNFDEETIFWSDVMLKTIRSISLQGGGNQLLTDNVGVPDGLAYDWIHGNLYWTDTGYDKIKVMFVKKKYTKTLFNTGMSEPRAIVVDPRSGHGWMYWTDWGSVPKIERAGMDGSARQTIVTLDLEWPNGLTIDFAENRLYWVDGKANRIASSNFNGQNVQTVLDSGVYLEHPFAITVFGDWLYWTDWQSKAIRKVNKYTGSGLVNIVNNLYFPMDVHVYHKQRQPQGASYCGLDLGGCSHLCLPRPHVSGSKSYQCACPDGMRLSSDDLTCI